MSTRCEISMIEARKQRLKVMIIEDEEDILTLYNDYLSSKGYDVIARYTGANNIKTDIERQSADVYLIDSRLPGKKSGTDVATEILDANPSAPILFITADQSQPQQIEKNPTFHHRNIDILLKPVKLNEIEHSMLNLMNN
ncbi:MAG: response regulator [Nitrososphaeraceae archaeon]|nr:response regulator [Nitrososphaeraceae archaeon]MDW0327350.1 response regulator [Nitrososphaeraceae archaeon]